MILDAFKFTNSLFVGNVSKFLIVVFPMFILQFLVYLVFTSVPGNEFGTTTSIAAQGQQLIINLISLYAMPLCILLIDDIHKERSRPISNYFTHALFLFFRIFFISLITVFSIVFGLILFIFFNQVLASLNRVVHGKVLHMDKKRTVLVTLDEVEGGISELVRVVVSLLGRKGFGVLIGEGIVVGAHPTGNGFVKTVGRGVLAQMCFTVVRRGISVFLQSFGEGDRDHGAGAGAQVLAAQEGFDRPIGVHLDGAGRGPGPAAPAVQGHAQSPLDRLAAALAMSVPLGLPVDQLRTDLHFLGVDIRLGCLVEVLHEDVVAVGSHLRRQVIDHRVGDRTQLRVRGSSPGPVRPGVGRDARRLAVAVGDPVETVGKLSERNRAAGDPAGAPVVAVPDGDVAFGIGRDRDFGEPARAGPPDLQLGGPVEHQSDRLAGL